MARPVRKDVDYFPHPCIQGPKMDYIRSIYKNDGHSVWYSLLEIIGRTDDHYIDFNNMIQKLNAISRCGVPEEKLFEIINKLVEIGVFYKQLWVEKKILFNQKFIDNIQDVYERRTNKCINIESLCEHLSIKCTTETQLMYKNSYSYTHTKLNYTKLNYTKLKKELYLLSEKHKNKKVNEEWKKYVDMRELQGKPLNIISAKEIIKFLAAHCYDNTEIAVYILNNAVRGQWLNLRVLDDQDKMDPRRKKIIEYYYKNKTD